mmetsp:Transcript_59195/g.125464  ORF Transcript_59195/g.125464 Transcript_59195/m.125464 type:complete len:254 (+) Transcript_59195:488-1249(+)
MSAPASLLGAGFARAPHNVAVAAAAVAVAVAATAASETDNATAAVGGAEPAAAVVAAAAALRLNDSACQGVYSSTCPVIAVSSATASGAAPPGAFAASAAAAAAGNFRRILPSPLATASVTAVLFLYFPFQPPPEADQVRSLAFEVVGAAPAASAAKDAAVAACQTHAAEAAFPAAVDSLAVASWTALAAWREVRAASLQPDAAVENATRGELTKIGTCSATGRPPEHGKSNSSRRAPSANHWTKCNQPRYWH